MRKKIVWVVVSGLMVLSLVVASCGQPTPITPTTPTTPITPITPITPTTPTTTTPAVEVPKYGGVLKVGQSANIIDFDTIVSTSPSGAHTFQVTNEDLWRGDWTKGPAGGYGTNETTWTGLIDIWEHKAGYIAESWELPDKIEGELATIIWHIRKGVHFALSPVNPRPAELLVGGREVTADDVVFCLSTYFNTPDAYLYISNPELRDAKITSPEPWTVKIEVPWDAFTAAVMRSGDYAPIVPPEVLQKWGIGCMRDWKFSVGTGPFILTDFVDGSTATMVRNPNYWMKDPIGPGKGNQLPYLDGVKYLIIPDKSTQFAALRTGKMDWFGRGAGSFGGEPTLEDKISLKKTAPQIMSGQISLSQTQDCTAMKMDRPPFNDIRVRRALMMAIDFESIVSEYFGGEAQYVVYPIPYIKEYADAYYGPDEQGQWSSDCPESIKELYSYNPEKARALLAEAGYPQGFNTNIIIENSAIDYYSIIKDMWSKVGVDLELRPKESAAFETIKKDKSYDQMMTGICPKLNKIYIMDIYHGKGKANQSQIDDPVVNEAYPKVQSAVAIGNYTEANRLLKELMKYMLDQVWSIPAVNPYLYNIWWPWLKNYSGEVMVGPSDLFFTWVWIDQELKKSMGY